MHPLHESSFLGGILDPTVLLHNVGPWAVVVVIAIVFVETGLLFPFLPGDSLVFAAAIVIAALGIPLWLLIVIVALTAAVGSAVGFAIGRRAGPRLFRDDARLFKSKYRDQADAFFARYGAWALILARFVPIVRTYVPPFVGASSMRWRVFLVWDVVGAIAWALLLTLAGFWLGKVTFVANNIEVIAIVVALISVLPIVIVGIRRRIRDRRSRRVELTVKQTAS
jgi:membrane-associated protein